MFDSVGGFAGGHGVAKNHTLAHEHYLDAHDAGQWRAPHALAITHQQGWGVQPNCSKAQRYIQTFLKERSPWTDQMDEAVLAVDAGQAVSWLNLLLALLACHPCPQAVLVQAVSEQQVLVHRGLEFLVCALDWHEMVSL